MPVPFTDVVALDTVDPDAPLDDLEPLAKLVGDARVVAIGESAHHIREFTRWRHRALRFLAEQCGFTVFAMESGFSEGLAVDAWVRGGAGDLGELAEHGITYRMGRSPEMREQLRWMRSSPLPLRFSGVDVPGSTASPLPALDNLRRYLSEIDADAVPLVDRIAEDARAYASEHTLLAYRAYAGIARADRDRTTALLADLAVRFDALAVEYTEAGGVQAYRTARRELRLTCLLDQGLRGFAAGADGGFTHPKVAARDRGMAETVLELLGPDTRIVLAAHNTHIQRTPMVTPAFTLSAMGHHLAHSLGEDYLAMAVTARAGRTSARRADPDAPGGVAITGVELPPAPDDSVEAAFLPSPRPQLVDLRAARGRRPGPERIRLSEGFLATPVLEAFDLAVSIPEITFAADPGQPG
jgi:erythromycin esterase